MWSVVYYVWNICYMKSSYDLRDILYEPVEAHLWYLYAMIPIYLVLPFFQIMCRHMSMKLERVFLLITTAAVLFNYILWMLGWEAIMICRWSETGFIPGMCLWDIISINTGIISG